MCKLTDLTISELREVESTGYCPKCASFVGVYEAARIITRHNEDERWTRLCTEYAQAENERNRKLTAAAFERNPNATSADILGSPGACHAPGRGETRTW